jgi:hypothetical protein
MLKDMDDEKVATNVIVAISDLCQGKVILAGLDSGTILLTLCDSRLLGLEEKDWEKALTIHRQLMTTEYERHGSWLLGLKRLIDLSEKAPSS